MSQVFKPPLSKRTLGSFKIELALEQSLKDEVQVSHVCLQGVVIDQYVIKKQQRSDGGMVEAGSSSLLETLMGCYRDRTTSHGTHNDPGES